MTRLCSFWFRKVGGWWIVRMYRTESLSDIVTKNYYYYVMPRLGTCERYAYQFDSFDEACRWIHENNGKR